MNNVSDIMHKKVLLTMLFVGEHGQGQKRTALEWVSFVKNIIHVNKIGVIELLNSKIKGEFYRFGNKEQFGHDRTVTPLFSLEILFQFFFEISISGA